jgi:dCTP deaminase
MYELVGRCFVKAKLHRERSAMSVLSDAKIISRIYSGELKIEPCNIDSIQPSSIDLTLDEDIETPKDGISISPPYPDRDKIRTYFKKGKLGKAFTLRPGEFILAQIRETISLSDKMVGNIQNRNSLIRLGINVGLSSYINPGYSGKLPIAIHNLGKFDFQLIAGMRICQLILTETQGVMKDHSRREGSKLSEDNEFTYYLRNYGENSDIAHMAVFLKQQIKDDKKDFFDQLSPEQKKELGLI